MTYDTGVPLKKARRLPRYLRRPVSQRTRSLVQRRFARRKGLKKERWQRRLRRLQRLFASAQRFTLRWVLVGVGLSLAVILGALVFSPALRLQEITVVRFGPRLNIEDVQVALAPLFERHLVFISQYEVRQLLEEAIPDIESTTVTKLYPSSLRVEARLDPLFYQLQITDPDPAVSPDSGSGSVSNIDFITSKGTYVTVLGGTGSGSLAQIQLVDWGAHPVPGTELLTEDFLVRLQAAERLLQREFGYNIEGRIVYLRAQEFHIDIGQYSLWFDTQTSVDDHLQRYRKLLQTIDPATVTLYVDLRLGDRIVYK